MKNRFLLIVCVLGFFTSFAQQKLWKVGLHSFFDNTEFGFSKVQMPQTMSGTHFAPELGLGWDSIHHVYCGADLLHEHGSDKTLDYVNPIAYYEYNFAPFRFYMGAFPRKVLEFYPRIFFSDSINNYRPTINGLFWEFFKHKSYLNVWLDWTSRQSPTRRETFFAAESGHLELGHFYLQHFGYMFHFAGTMNQAVYQSISDNLMSLSSFGVNFAEPLGFDKLETNVGWAIGLDRTRLTQDSYLKHNGLLLETKIEYRGLGLENTYYSGDGQMAYYKQYGMNLYWGDCIYRAKEYDRLDLYVRFMQTNSLTVKFMYSLHFTEQQMYHEQSLYVTLDLDNRAKKPSKPYRHIWDPLVQHLRN